MAALRSDPIHTGTQFDRDEQVRVSKLCVAKAKQFNLPSVSGASFSTSGGIPTWEEMELMMKARRQAQENQVKLDAPCEVQFESSLEIDLEAAHQRAQSGPSTLTRVAPRL